MKSLKLIFREHALCTPCAFTRWGHPAVCKHTPPCCLTPHPLKQVLIKNVVVASLKKFVNQAANDARPMRKGEGERERGRGRERERWGATGGKL